MSASADVRTVSLACHHKHEDQHHYGDAANRCEHGLQLRISKWLLTRLGAMKDPGAAPRGFQSVHAIIRAAAPRARWMRATLIARSKCVAILALRADADAVLGECDGRVEGRE